MPPPRQFRRAFFPIILLLCSWLLRVHLTMRSVCRTGEWQCGGDDAGKVDDTQNVQCISQNKFCDGIENCDDGSDEPIGCTNCNRSFIGDANIKYPVRVTGPFQRYLPFVCHISFVAAGKEFGDFVELTFLSFQIGLLEFTRNQTPICQKGYLRISEQRAQAATETLDLTRSSPFYQASTFSSQFEPKPESSPNPQFGKFCGSLVERSVAYFSENNNVSVLAVVPSRASIPSSSFSLYLTYRFLSRKIELPPASVGDPLPYLGSPVPGTYCDRLFNDCSSPYKRCTIRSPNFPGFYPRNISCQYLVRQQYVPEGHVSRIVLSQANDYKVSIPTSKTSSTRGTNFLLSADCDGADSVRIFDGPSLRSPVLLEFCGSGALPDVISSTNEILVHLYSAPYQLLRSSRLEIDIQVRFEKTDDEDLSLSSAGGTNGRCSQTFLGSRQRSGLVKTPNHSMSKDANCTYRFIGASSFDKVWIYFVSYFSPVHRRPTSSGEQTEFCPSRLDIFDSGGYATSNSTFRVGSQSLLEGPMSSFCGDISPKICAHASDYPPRFIPPRPCELSTESYVSAGSDFTIRHRFLSQASEIVSTTMSSFIARYEFVDTRQGGTVIDHSECDRRFDSRITKSGSITNPRNVFLYGRGGRNDISCMYHFVGLPSEKIRITLRKVKLIMNNSTCAMSYDSVMQKHSCKWLRQSSMKFNSPSPHDENTYSSISAVEFWDGYSSSLGCLCNATIESKQQPVIFESLVSNIKLMYTVKQMGTLMDFDDFDFYADYEFVNSSLCTQGLRRHIGATGEGVLNFQVPGNIEETYNDLFLPIRCRWLIEASLHRYLYLKIKGMNSSLSDRCSSGNRILVYLDPRSKPVANACVNQPSSTTAKNTIDEFDIFSHTWYNESHDTIDNRDRLFVEIIANPKEDKRNFELHWLEVTKPFVKTHTGQTLRNVDCLFECPEIGACIDPDLWCDGIVHCPSGYDETLEHCRTFPTAYVSSSLAGLIMVILLVTWILVRRRRLKRRCRKKGTRRLPQNDPLNMESPTG